jgi:D-threo-aldose 1-dehydrogenase
MASSLHLPEWGIGTAPLGGMYTSVSDEDASVALSRAWESGFRYFDTAPMYGEGAAETRLRQLCTAHPDGHFSSKCGRLLRSGNDSRGLFESGSGLLSVFDFSPAAICESVEGSLERLGLQHLDIMFVHDPDDHEAELDGAFETLSSLKEEGVIGAIGVGMTQWQMPLRLLDRFEIDVVLLAGRWSLLDQSGRPLLDKAAQRGIPVVIGGALNSGILAAPSTNATFDYNPADTRWVRRAERLRTICAQCEVPLLVAAIRFPHLHPSVSTVLVGVRHASEVEDFAAATTYRVPDELWGELANSGLVTEAPTNNARPER